MEKIIKDAEEYEEISEKKTSKLGYLLLILLVIFLIIIGQRVFSDIKNIPQKPTAPNSLMETYTDTESLKNLLFPPTYRKDQIMQMKAVMPENSVPLVDDTFDTNNIEGPIFGEIDKKFGIEENFENIDQKIYGIILLNRDIKTLDNQLEEKSSELNALLLKYNITLQEIMADEKGLFDKPTIKNSIILLDSEVSFLERTISEKEAERDAQINQIKPTLTHIKDSYKLATEYYKDREAYYNLWVFLLKLLFVMPFFGISLFYYFKLKKKNSPYAIIATAVFFASAILFLEITVIFLEQILPMEWLKRIFKIFLDIAALKYVLYYASSLLVIIIFGGIVYFIQKKVFDKKRIAIRRIKEGKCPSCSFMIERAYEFCPKCGNELKENCQNCGSRKIKDMPFCQICGKK